MNRNLLLTFFITVLLLTACAKKASENSSDNGAYIEDYITQLKEIERNSSEKFSKLMLLLENMDENSNDSAMPEIRELMQESIDANKAVVEDFRVLAGKPKPDFVDDTTQILLTTATAILAQSYELRIDAQTWLNRFVSLGDNRFLDEYSSRLSQAMQFSREGFSFLTAARVRQRVLTGDTLDMTLSEFLKIPELPDTAKLPAPDFSEIDTAKEIKQ